MSKADENVTKLKEAATKLRADFTNNGHHNVSVRYENSSTLADTGETFHVLKCSDAGRHQGYVFVHISDHSSTAKWYDHITHGIESSELHADNSHYVRPRGRDHLSDLESVILDAVVNNFNKQQPAPVPGI